MMISGYLIYGVPVLLGFLFVVFGSIIKQYPVAITVTSLVLYVLATVVFGLLTPIRCPGVHHENHHHFRPDPGDQGGACYQDHTQKAAGGRGNAG